ncbi:hypothetical protein [Herbaspirillum rhizosphaerae]|uniref:hypothetical protein n=1 Tax=Herbaspirillum rhizosphaerae TaxID=346179 RepID=UPI00196A1C3C|nr:hypothetical protein [Herbaspirillum rhizosphaerae]
MLVSFMQSPGYKNCCGFTAGVAITVRIALAAFAVAAENDSVFRTTIAKNRGGKKRQARVLTAMAAGVVAPPAMACSCRVKNPGVVSANSVAWPAGFYDLILLRPCSAWSPHVGKDSTPGLRHCPMKVIHRVITGGDAAIFLIHRLHRLRAGD